MISRADLGIAMARSQDQSSRRHPKIKKNWSTGYWRVKNSKQHGVNWKAYTKRGK